MTSAAPARTKATRKTVQSMEAEAAHAYLPFVADDFVAGKDGTWRASGVPVPSDLVERIEIAVTLKPGVRLQDVGRSCAHAAVDVSMLVRGGRLP